LVILEEKTRRKGKLPKVGPHISKVTYEKFSTDFTFAPGMLIKVRWRSRSFLTIIGGLVECAVVVRTTVTCIYELRVALGHCPCYIAQHVVV
jgi:hypothetical protein